MSKITKATLALMALWVFAQLVAWFYVGKEVAGITALFVGVIIVIIYPLVFVTITESEADKHE